MSKVSRCASVTGALQEEACCSLVAARLVRADIEAIEFD